MRTTSTSSIISWRSTPPGSTTPFLIITQIFIISPATISSPAIRKAKFVLEKTNTETSRSQKTVSRLRVSFSPAKTSRCSPWPGRIFWLGTSGTHATCRSRPPAGNARYPPASARAGEYYPSIRSRWCPPG